VLGGEPKIAQVQIRNPIASKRFDEDKLSILDILATDDHGRLIDIEIQTTLPAGLAERLTYYAASQLIEQLGEGDSYRNLRPSIGICILDALLFRESANLHLDFQLRSRTGERLTDCLQIHLLELPKYVLDEDNGVPSDPIRQWMHFFRFAAISTPEELRRQLPDPVFTEAIGVLEMIAKNPEERRFYESRLKMQRDETARLEAAEARGEAIGRVRVLQSLAGVEESSVEQLPSSSLHAKSAAAVSECEAGSRSDGAVCWLNFARIASIKYS
jgi:predicted transposase/invertase (TIGR01784 family)